MFWTILFCLLYFPFFGLLSSQLRLSYWQPANENILNIYSFEHSTKNPDVVIMGSSRVRVGISPLVIEDKIFRETKRALQVFNVGQDAGTIRISYAILKNVLRGSRCPKVILLGVEPWGFNSNTRSNRLAYFQYYAQPLDIIVSLDKSLLSDEIDPRVQGFLRGISNLLWLIGKNPLQHEYQEHLQLLRTNKGASPIPEQDNLPGMGQSRRDYIINIQVANYKKLLSDYEIEGIADDAFRNFIKVCNKRGIKLITFTMPVLPAFMENYKNNEYSIFIQYITSMCERENIKFYNLAGEIAVLDESHYHDPDHLTENGAIIVSKYVADKILVPALEDM